MAQPHFNCQDVNISCTGQPGGRVAGPCQRCLLARTCRPAPANDRDENCSGVQGAIAPCVSPWGDGRGDACRAAGHLYPGPEPLLDLLTGTGQLCRELVYNYTFLYLYSGRIRLGSDAASAQRSTPLVQTRLRNLGERQAGLPAVNGCTAAAKAVAIGTVVGFTKKLCFSKA